jgi:hypothetical protein
LGVACLLAGAMSGCGRNEVRVYSIPKEAGQAAPMVAGQGGALPAGHPEVGGGEPKLQWKLPAGWEQAAAGEMRAASFRVKGEGKQADVGIVPLPGLAGGDLENVNRWRGQVGQGPITEAELQKAAQPVEISGQTAQLYEQAGQSAGSGEATRILAAILRREGTAWFFKMTGDDLLVAAQKPAFVEFLKSVTFGPGEAQVALGDAGQLPASHPPINVPGMAAPAARAGPAAASESGKPTWQVPARWQEGAAGQFLVAKYVVTGADNAQASVNISMSAGDGGGVGANVNRWRAQLGLAALSEAELPKQLESFEVSGGKGTLVEMTGTDARSGQKAKLVAAIVPQAGQTWFYKLMGGEALVEREKGTFTKFVQTAKY